MAIVYLHRRIDTGQVFYVGVGNTKKRAKDKSKRSNFWKSIVSKHPYEIDIVKRNISREQALEIEAMLIQYYGRRDLGKGPLCNLTDGGEGTPGHNVDRLYKQVSCYTKKGTLIKTFKSLTDAASYLGTTNISNISACLLGRTATAYDLLWFYGNNKRVPKVKKTTKSVKVIDLFEETTKIYESSKIVSKILEIPYNSVRGCCYKNLTYQNRYKMSYIQ